MGITVKIIPPFTLIGKILLAEMSETLKPERMTVVDALRGFSLAGIAIVHMVENYVGGPLPEGAMTGAEQGIPDQVVNIFCLLFLRGKFFALFSFLFGLSFFIQMDSGSRQSAHFEGRFAWRLLLLLAIGFLNHLFYRGDILTVYALLGLLLIPFYQIRSGIVLGVAAVLFLGAPRFLLYALGQAPGLLVSDLINPDNPLIGAYYDTLRSGSIWEVFRSNAWSGHLMKMEFQVGVGSRAYLTFGFFLLGLWFGRTGYFRRYTDLARQTRRALWFSVAGLLLFTLLAGLIFMQMGPNPDFNSGWAMTGLTVLDLGNLGMTGLILSGFMLLYRKPWWQKALGHFAPFGRMALTNYVAQSVIGTFFFYGWGLGLLGEMRNSYALLLALVIICLQMRLSRWWLKRFRYGPLEWAWRSLTHFRRFPIAAA